MAVDTLDPNLLQSAKKPKIEAPKIDGVPVQKGLTRKGVLKVAAYTAFFLWSVTLFTFLKIPDSVIANSLLNSLNQNTPYQWQAETIRLGFFPFLHLRIEKLGLEPKIPGNGIPLFLDELRIYPNPFSLIPIGGPAAIGGSFRAEIYKADLHGSISTGNNFSIRLETPTLDIARVTPLANSGMDLKGIFSDVFVQLAMPSQRLALADGEISLRGKNVIFDPASLQLGLALPILNFGDVDVKATVNRGQVKLDKFKLGSPGKDLEVQIPIGTITLSDVSFNTRYDLHLLLKPSAGIQVAVPGLISMLDSMATKKPDGFYALRLQGTLAAPAFPTKD